MNRREFLRSLVASSVLIGIGVVGIDQMINLAKGTPSAAPPSQILTPTHTTTSSGASSGQSTQGAGFGTNHTANNYSFCPRRLCPDSCAESAKRENLHLL